MYQTRFLKITGDHAQTFLQGQLTCDVQQTPCLGAHCNIKGRVLFSFMLTYRDNAYWMKLPSSMLSIAKKRLEKFAVFSHVAVEETPLYETGGILTDKKSEIEQGLVTIYPETSGLFTPHELNYPKFNIVHFKKGCYTGQEVIARMEYLGKLKTKLFSMLISNPTEHHCLGAPVYNGSQEEIGLLADYVTDKNKLILLVVGANKN